MKKIIIILSTLFLASILGILLSRPQLEIKSSSGKINVFINDKKIEVTDSKAVRVWPGKYTVRGEKNLYQAFKTETEIGFFEKKTIEINLTAQQEIDKEEINKLAKDFIERWYTYNKQSDVAYLIKIKPFLTSSYYESTDYINTQRPQDFKDQTPQKAVMTSFTLWEIHENTATGVGEYEATNLSNGVKKKYKTNLNFKKENGEWKVDYSKTII